MSLFPHGSCGMIIYSHVGHCPVFWPNLEYSETPPTVSLLLAYFSRNIRPGGPTCLTTTLCCLFISSLIASWLSASCSIRHLWSWINIIFVAVFFPMYLLGFHSVPSFYHSNLSSFGVSSFFCFINDSLFVLYHIMNWFIFEYLVNINWFWGGRRKGMLTLSCWSRDLWNLFTL